MSGANPFLSAASMPAQKRSSTGGYGLKRKSGTNQILVWCVGGRDAALRIDFQIMGSKVYPSAGFSRPSKVKFVWAWQTT